jgi:hypothetical protein
MDALAQLSAHVGAIAQSLASVVQQLAIVTQQQATLLAQWKANAAASSSRARGSGSRRSIDEAIDTIAGDVALNRDALRLAGSGGSADGQRGKDDGAGGVVIASDERDATSDAEADGATHDDISNDEDESDDDDDGSTEEDDEEATKHQSNRLRMQAAGGRGERSRTLRIE